MRRSIMEDFFRTDPFFSDPFLGSPFVSAFDHPPPRQQRHTPSVRIEEISEDTSDNEAEHDEPIVEQPDSNNGSYYNEPHRRTPNSFNAMHEFPPFAPFSMMPGMMPMMPMMPMMMPGMMSGMMQGFGGLSNMGSGGAYFSSSVQSFSSSGDGNTAHYSKTSTTKAGPSGLLEKQETERDSSTGLERISLHRQLGDRARTVTRERKQGGQEVCRESLRGISQEEASRFDQEWTTAAGQHLHPHPGRANRLTRPAITSPHSHLPPINALHDNDSRSRSSAPTNYHQSASDIRSHPYTPTNTRASSQASTSADPRYHNDRSYARSTRDTQPRQYSNSGFYR